jgi:hypothetical protein
VKHASVERKSEKLQTRGTDFLMGGGLLHCLRGDRRRCTAVMFVSLPATFRFRPLTGDTVTYWKLIRTRASSNVAE